MHLGEGVADSESVGQPTPGRRRRHRRRRHPAAAADPGASPGGGRRLASPVRPEVTALARLAPGTLPSVPASITLDFNPQTTILGADLRLETLAIAAVIFVGLVFAGFWAGFPGAGLFERHPEGKEPRKLRRDDLILIAFGVVPGAVVGGRLDYVLVHLDYYQKNPNAITDVAQGGLGLTLAVVLGAMTGAAVAKLMNAPIGRWFAVLAMPTMFVLGAGKLATVLGGGGQGQYSDASYATSYAGAGPWESLNASYPAIPSQAYEGLMVLAAMLVIWIVPAVLRLRVRRWHRFIRPGIGPRHPWSLFTGGRRFLTAIGVWAVLRFVAAFTWRDAQVYGRYNVEQLILAPVIVVAIAGPTVTTLTVLVLRATGRGLMRLGRHTAAAIEARADARRQPRMKLATLDESKVQPASAATPGDGELAGEAPVFETKLPVDEDPKARRAGRLPS